MIGVWLQKEIGKSIESTEIFMVALIDTAIAAQNAAIAGESMGLGICFISVGGIQNNLVRVQDILQTPKRVLPLFGLALGVSFKDQSLTQEQIQLIVKSAQVASSSSYIQAYSIIGVTDLVKKEQQLAEVAGNQFHVPNQIPW